MQRKDNWIDSSISMQNKNWISISVKFICLIEEFGIVFAFNGPVGGMSIKTVVMVIEDTPEIVTEPYVVFLSKSHTDLAITEAICSKLNIGQRIRTISSIKELFSYLNHLQPTAELPSLIVIDVEKEETTEFLKEWKSFDQFKNIPVLIYSSTLNYQEEKEWLKQGASYCRKKRKTNEGLPKLLIEFISLADIQHEMNTH